MKKYFCHTYIKFGIQLSGAMARRHRPFVYKDGIRADANGFGKTGSQWRDRSLAFFLCLQAAKSIHKYKHKRYIFFYK